ncbi:MAG: acetyltransferase [Planctomycetota bacterium]|nr:acetyltransferase [Planctomycetota bacterium]
MKIEEARRILLVGAGSHGRVVFDLLRDLGVESRVAGFLDAVHSRTGEVEGVPLLGGPDDIEQLATQFDSVLLPIGDGVLREQWARTVREMGLPLLTAIHPRSVISSRAFLEPGVMVSAGAIIVTGAQVGTSCIVNTGATIDHDCAIDAYAHICPGAHLAGCVQVGTRTMVGVGASVKQGVRIGADVRIGAGAAVVEDIPDGVTAVGVPARWS